MKEKLFEYRKVTQGFDVAQFLEWGLQTFGIERLALASSLGVEDQVLTALLLKVNPKARIFTLDTGRLFQETYDTMQASVEKYHFHYEVCFPEASEVQELVKEKGPNLFYNSIADRKSCCDIRKMRPLRKKLKTVDCWVTGLRREQSVTRTDFHAIEWDDNFQIFKLNPLIDWSEKAVWDFIKTNDVPYNKLHDNGFPSIGCQPCTRAVKSGGDIRSGRWWWESPEQKECGLHWKNGAIISKQIN